MMTSTPKAIRLGLGPNLAQFSLLVVVNAFVGAMVGLERTHPAGHRRAGLPPRRADGGPLLHRRLRRHQGAHQLLRRAALGLRRPQARARRRLARRAAGSLPPHVGALVELGPLRERAARREPGPHLVDHGHHEDRPRRARAPRSRDGAQRVRRLRRGRALRARDRLHGGSVRAAARSRSISGSRSPRSVSCSRRCSFARRTATRTTRRRTTRRRPTPPRSRSGRSSCARRSAIGTCRQSARPAS